MNTNRSYIKMLLTGVICCLGGAFLAFGDAKAGEAAFFKEEFNGSTLPPGWTIWDGYALNQPADLTNHAIFSMTRSHLSISFPAGVEHNMWWLRHAQVTRLYEGSGVYEIKVDSSFDGSQQFGLVLRTARVRS